MISLKLPLAILLLMLTTACSSSRQPVPPGTIPQPPPPTPQEEAEGHQAMQQLTQKWELDYNHPRYQEVLRTVERLTTAANANQDPWHVFVLEDNLFKNAAATKGNHVFVWTGMIDATSTETELATVLGHEIGHVLARHSNKSTNETIRETLIEVGALAAGIAVAQATRNPHIANDAGRMTSHLTKQLGNAIAVYPYGRALELEADHIGLFLMSKAGYNPEEAVGFWQKASKDSDFSGGLSFLSTHPPAEERLEKLKSFLPLALEVYNNRHKIKQQGEIKSSSSHLQNQDARKTRDWIVAKNNAKLFTSPDKKSAIKGEFKKGTTISPEELIRGWAKISSPDSGYLRVDDLLPVEGQP